MRKFHVVFWYIIRFLFTPFLKLKFNYDVEVYRGKGPTIILANHTTDWDPILLGCAFPRHMYFVASEHIFRSWLSAKFLKFFFDPILRLKSVPAIKTIYEMMHRLQAGYNIAMFPEGDRSFDGRTISIVPTTGSLVKNSGATLVLYRMEGGYFTSPRWCGSSLRRGRMKGHIAAVYTKEELSEMSTAQINKAINEALYVDAYEVQHRQMVPYRGKKLAEHLETALYMCPKCGQVGKLSSNNDQFTCECGFTVTLNECGFFVGEHVPFDTITAWYAWQNEQLKGMLTTDDVIFTDDHMNLYHINNDHIITMEGSGIIALYRDHLECCGKIFALSDITGFSLQGPQQVNISIGKNTYELSSEKVRCTLKYKNAIEMLKKLSL